MRTTENGGQITDFLRGFALAKAVIRFLYSVFCMHLEFFNKKFRLSPEFSLYLSVFKQDLKKKN